MNDPIEKLAEMYPTLANGQKHIAREVKEAILEMQAHLADLESTLQLQPLPEAPASITVKVVDPDTQMEYLVTVREARAGLALIGRIPDISAAITGLGLVAMDAYIDGRRAERENTKALTVHPSGYSQGSPAGATQPKSVSAVIQGSALTFKAETLETSTKGDRTYYKVKGGKFTKFGVTVWPEVLQDAGIDLDTLPGVMGLTGYTAHYILNEKGDPAKVIGLEPA